MKKRFYVEKEYDGDLILNLSNSNPLPGNKYLPEHLYYHLLKQVNPHLDNEAKRRQTLSVFHTNFKISLIPTILFLIYIGYNILGSVEIFVAMIFTLLISVGPLYMYMVYLLEITVGDPKDTHISDLLREYLYQVESEN